jgi:hypothetical protein
VRFVDFLKTTVLACAGAATVLGALALRTVALDDDTSLLTFALCWWTVATLLGVFLGRQRATLPAIARLLAGARSTSTLPDQGSPGRLVANRLWPLFLLLVLSAGLGWLFPQVPVIAAGFLVIWALYWRRQEGAVTAIEERDGVAFFIERTKPWEPIQLVRTPGFRRISAPPSVNGAGS